MFAALGRDGVGGGDDAGVGAIEVGDAADGEDIEFARVAAVVAGEPEGEEDREEPEEAENPT